MVGVPTKEENVQWGRKGWNASGAIAMPGQEEMEAATERKPPKSQGENGKVTKPDLLDGMGWAGIAFPQRRRQRCWVWFLSNCGGATISLNKLWGIVQEDRALKRA